MKYFWEAGIGATNFGGTVDTSKWTNPSPPSKRETCLDKCGDKRTKDYDYDCDDGCIFYY